MDCCCKRRLRILALQILLIAYASCGGAQVDRSGPVGTSRLDLTSSAFEDGQSIAAQYTCEGKDVSPSLKWGPVPQRAKTLAVVCDDPDAPGGSFVHWVLYNVPAAITELQEAMPAAETLKDGGLQGTNDFDRIGYNGPCPPRGSAHRYRFKLYALDIGISLKPGARRQELENAMRGHVLAEGVLIGKYARK